MITMDMFKDEDIIYNEETGLYELYVNGGQFRASGTWESCLAALREFYYDGGDDDYDAGQRVEDFVTVKTDRDTVGDYQLDNYTRAIGDVADEIEFLAQFGVSILDIMTDAKIKMQGEDMETRREIKIGAYDKLRALIDKKAAELWEE